MLSMALATILTGSNGFTTISLIGIGADTSAIMFLEPLSFRSLNGIVLFLYPINDTSIVFEVERSPILRVNSPSMLVTIATFDSFTATVANTSGCLVSESITFPLITKRLCWSLFFLPEVFPADTSCAMKARRRASTINEVCLKVFMSLFIKLNNLSSFCCRIQYSFHFSSMTSMLLLYPMIIG